MYLTSPTTHTIPPEKSKKNICFQLQMSSADSIYQSRTGLVVQASRAHGLSLGHMSPCRTSKQASKQQEALYEAYSPL